MIQKFVKRGFFPSECGGESCVDAGFVSGGVFGEVVVLAEKRYVSHFLTVDTCDFGELISVVTYEGKETEFR